MLRRLERQVGAWQVPSLRGLVGAGSSAFPQEPPQRNPLVPSPAVSLSLSPPCHPHPLGWQTATITMATLAPACSPTTSRSQSRGRAAGLISLPIELGSFKTGPWLHTADARPSRSPGGLTSNKHKMRKTE